MAAKSFIKCMALYIIIIFMTSAPLLAQDSPAKDKSTSDDNTSQDVIKMKTGESHFMMVGLVTMGFVYDNTSNTIGGVTTTSKTNSFADADRFEFSPMLLWRHGDKLLVEFEPSWDGNADGLIGVNWADVSYYVAPGLIIRGGYLVLPFGTYTKRLAAGWINKLPSDPPGTEMAGTDFGVEAEGGFPLGSMKWSYDVALSNGLKLNPDGTTETVGVSAINNAKTVCGRLALLPLSNSSLEIGVSGLYGSLASTEPEGTYTNPLVNMYALDLNFVQHINPFQINIKAQYSMESVNTQNYSNPTDSSKYTFTNTSSALFGQIAVRPEMADSKILKNLELAYRYVNYTTPQNSSWGQNYTESDLSLDYWLTWRTVLKLAYENVKYDGTSNASLPITGPEGSTSTNRIILQFATEF